MIDLTTRYLGLTLKNPLVPSSSPFTRALDDARRLEDAGASALVMHSLFEEEIRNEEEHYARFFYQQSIGHAEADSFHPVPEDFTSRLDQHLEQLQALKQSLDIPVIASLNGISLDGWVSHGKQLEEAGADALELNVYYIAADAAVTAQDVEDRYIRLLHALKQSISLPVTMKLSPHFSALPHTVKALESAGADGVSLFNRFYQPDIDLDTLQMQHHLELSSPDEALLRIRWIGILRGQVQCSLAATGGLHRSEDILKALLAGADVTHLCSALLQHGPGKITSLLAEISAWMELKEYSSVEQLKGSVSREHATDPAAYEHNNYFKVLESYRPAKGILR